MRIITDYQAVGYVLQHKGSFVCYMGAGLSAEARVPMASEICRRIFAEKLPKGLSKQQEKRWANETLAWDDPTRRYVACMLHYGTAAHRVQFFRGLLQAAKPAFSHHTLALLMARGHLRQTCITTNFDKLLEGAFMRHGLKECQPIRHEDEVAYLEKEDDKCYVLKLHGDYDTYNILNTEKEVFRLNPKMAEAAARVASGAGLLVLGAAGYEKSISSLFEELTRPENEGKVFPYGLLWGVYVPGPKPAGQLSQRQLEKIVREQLDGGAVGPEIINMMNRTEGWEENFCFFPVWGAKNFLLDLVKEAGDTWLRVMAESYLDRDMRLRQVFERAGISPAAISKHISTLMKHEEELEAKAKSSPPEHETVAVATSKAAPLEVHVAYGDIAKRAWMASDAFKGDVRAVVSPEDTCVSAGGGVARNLLRKAGPSLILNELGKFAPIPHTAVAVTSGGGLPAHYILHAAAIEITEGRGGDVEYVVSPQSVEETMTNILRKAAALDVGTLWVPLMGAGVASQKGKFGAQQSIESILKAVAAWKAPNRPVKVFIVVYADKVLTRDKARAALRRRLGTGFTIRSVG